MRFLREEQASEYSDGVLPVLPQDGPPIREGDLKPSEDGSSQRGVLACCPRCEYDLSANTSRICPECGWEADTRVSFWSDGRVGFGWPLLLALGPLLIILLVSAVDAPPPWREIIAEFMYGSSLARGLGLSVVLAAVHMWAAVSIAGSRCTVYRARRQAITLLVAFFADAVAVFLFMGLCILTFG